MGTTPTASTTAPQLRRRSDDSAPGVGPDLPAMFDRYRPCLEAAMARAVPPLEQHAVNTLLRYHLGWSDRNGAPSPAPTAQGKALRPTLCMFACDAFQGELGQAAPAAAALELTHNFSLVHDDIQDQGAERRHQPTVWAVWGPGRALVAGDAMQSLGDAAALPPDDAIPVATALRVSGLLTDSYLEMIEGQCRDLQFEARDRISADEYLDMIALKTGALIRSSLVIGATIATGAAADLDGVARFGQAIGRLFQIRDDYLGIWGDAAVTGKSTDSDIVQRKKSYPIVYAFQKAAGTRRAELRRLYAQETLADSDVDQVMEILDDLGAARQTNALIETTADAGRQALAALELPPWATADADNLIDFMAYRSF